MTELSPEANQVLYANTAGESLAEQLQSAYNRNIAEGRAVVMPDSLAAAAELAVAETLAFDPNGLSTRERSIAEAILEQFDSSYRGRVATVDALNDTIGKLEGFEPVESPNEAATKEQLDILMTHWVKSGELGYIDEQCRADPDTEFTLVATPELTKKQGVTGDHEIIGMTNGAITDALLVFARGQPESKGSVSNYCSGFSAEQIYGQLADEQEVCFSLVPATPSRDLIPAKDAAGQNAILTRLQNERPDLYLHVESPLAQLSRLFTLRIQKGPEALKSPELTYTRNFDLKPESLSGGIPFMEIREDGFVFAGISGTGEERDSLARISIW
jgi:hypothetical protein